MDALASGAAVSDRTGTHEDRWYDEFITSVRERGVPREEAETLTHATLRVLAERLTGGEADDIRAQQRAMTLAARTGRNQWR
jgi:uncharacterized protein (DUF2267 family)